MTQPPIAPVTKPALDDLQARLRQARYPLLPSGLGWKRGTDPEALSWMVEYWLNSYDWREHEARILALPWREIESEASALRVVHQPASDAQAPVVLLLHGWPDSVLRFERVFPLLRDVTVVAPALPGFPFAAPLMTTGMNVKVMAKHIAEAMAELGYHRYVISGGDVGADVAEHLATLYPDRVGALHLTAPRSLRRPLHTRCGRRGLSRSSGALAAQRGWLYCGTIDQASHARSGAG